MPLSVGLKDSGFERKRIFGNVEIVEGVGIFECVGPWIVMNVEVDHWLIGNEVPVSAQEFLRLESSVVFVANESVRLLLVLMVEVDELNL